MNIMERSVRDRPSAPHLATWALSRGRSAFTTAEIARLLDVPQDQVRRRLAAPQSRNEWVSPARGLWIAVPPEYRLWGAPPALDYIDAMMSHLRIDYYVGWLSAAALYGATHQAVQVFQVATGSTVADRDLGRNRMRFHTRSRVGKVPTRQHVTRAGYARVSTIATTMFDVATDAMIAAGLDNAGTVIVELSEHEDFAVDDLIELVPQYPIGSARRIGWFLENFTEVRGLDRLACVSRDAASRPSRLHPQVDPSGPVDPRWMLYLNYDELEVEA